MRYQLGNDDAYVKYFSIFHLITRNNDLKNMFLIVG